MYAIAIFLGLVARSVHERRQRRRMRGQLPANACWPARTRKALLQVSRERPGVVAQEPHALVEDRDLVRVPPLLQRLQQPARHVAVIGLELAELLEEPLRHGDPPVVATSHVTALQTDQA